ncbi:MAG: fibronectin type III domain-containing protein [Candidatus Pacebacteria bacterium]|nr:fibronectin type III domain-containing protein [Candidatus Paceibacterota bacterium]
MKNYFKNITIALLALTIVASPFATFAKDNDNRGKGSDDSKSKKEQSKNDDRRGGDDDDHDDDDDRDDDKNRNRGDKNDSRTTTCSRVYGRLIGLGWLKKSDLTDEERAYFVANCYLPFGIHKKFRGNNATTTPDTTAPTISNITSNAGRVQADVRWNTNEYADSVVFWDTDDSIDTSDSSSKKVSNSRLTKNHQVLLKNLTADTTYYYTVRSKDVAGNQTLSGMNSFKTKAPSSDAQFPVISTVVTSVGTTSITVGWKTNEVTTDRVYYSTSLPVTINASSTSYVSNASSTKIHNLPISGLSANTTYYLVIESTDSAGNVSTSATFSAKTSALPVVSDTAAPVLSSIAAVAGASTSTISWMTNEVSTSKVFYSTSTPLDTGAATTQSVLNGSLVTSHSIDLSGLATSTTYYFKVQSVDASGNTATSNEFSATTLAQ